MLKKNQLTFPTDNGPTPCLGVFSKPLFTSSSSIRLPSPFHCTSTVHLFPPPTMTFYPHLPSPLLFRISIYIYIFGRSGLRFAFLTFPASNSAGVSRDWAFWLLRVRGKGRRKKVRRDSTQTCESVMDIK